MNTADLKITLGVRRWFPLAAGVLIAACRWRVLGYDAATKAMTFLARHAVYVVPS